MRTEDHDSDQTRLEELIHEQLQQLPPLRAPATLAPKVLREISKKAARPWWHRPWFEWPLACQIVSAVLAFSVISSGLYWVSQSLGPAQLQFLAWLSNSFGWVAALLKVPVIAYNALPLDMPSWKVFLPIVLLSSAAIYLWCFGLGVVCFRIAVAQPKTPY